jgi:hypothetical protein
MKRGVAERRRSYPKYDSIPWSYILVSSFHFPIPFHPFLFLYPFPSLPFNPLKSLLIDTKKPLRGALLVLWLHHSHARLRRIAFATTMFTGLTRTSISALATSQSAQSLAGRRLEIVGFWSIYARVAVGRRCFVNHCGIDRG